MGFSPVRALIGLIAALAVAMPAAAQGVLKIGFVDPLSGGASSTGEAGLRTFQYMAEQLNAKGGPAGYKIEVTGYDNKVNPQESLVQVQKAIDNGARIIIQGNGSAVAAAITDFVAKYNERNPGKEIIYLNYAAIDPVLTNEKCNYWHFRWDASVDIKMEAMTNFMKSQPAIKKVYLINQDYSFGRSVRDNARALLQKKRPDIEIVGDDLHPLQKVTDFAPYVAKIKAAGADTVITGNWAQDFALLLKAAGDASLQVGWYTFYAGGIGGPVAVKQAGLPERVYQVSEGIANVDHAESRAVETAFRQRVGQSIIYPRGINLMRMLAAAVEKTKSDDPLKIAAALEDMKADVFNGGQGFMRADDHQFFQPMYISVLGPNGVKPFDEEGTGWGWSQVARIEADATVVPTTCKMTRPQ